MSIKMDSRGPLILVCCILSTFAIIVLFVVTFRMSRLSCELVYVEPEKLRSEAISDWKETKASRSQDRSMLIKLAAHLEYYDYDYVGQTVSDATSTPLAASGNNLNQARPAQQQQQFQQQIPGLPVPIDNTTGRHPVPSVPQSGFTNQQLLNSSVGSSFGANSSNINNNSSGNNQKRDTKRFQQLVLEDVKMEKSEEDYKYTLRFTCATIIMDFIRRPDRVHVKQVHIDLKPAGFNGKSSCDLYLPAQGAFSVEVNANDHLAHYYCDKPLRYECFHHPSGKDFGKPPHRLADLLIHKLEFELPGNNSLDWSSVHKNHSFLSRKSKLSLI